MKYFFLLLLVFTSSCSFLGIKPINRSSDESIVIDEQIESYGPESKIINEKVTKIEREPVLALILGPGLYRAAAHIGLLRSLERENIPINIIVGSGFSSLVASYFAAEKKTSIVEWKLFNLIKSLDPEERIYSSSWKEDIIDFLEGDFSQTSLESLNIPTILPLYHLKQKNVYYVKRGNLLSILQVQLSLTSIKDLSFLPPARKVFFSSQALKKRGADIVIALDVLQSGLSFKRDDGFVLGAFQRIIQRTESDFSKIEHKYSLIDSNIPLDDASRFSEMITLGEAKGDIIAQEIKSIIENWKKENNP